MANVTEQLDAIVEDRVNTIVSKRVAEFTSAVRRLDLEYHHSYHFLFTAVLNIHARNEELSETRLSNELKLVMRKSQMHNSLTSSLASVITRKVMEMVDSGQPF